MDWHEEAALRREERAMRRAQRAEIAVQERRQGFYSVVEAIAAFTAIYGLMWLGCLWAAI